MRILLIEDEPLIAQAIKTFLERYEFRIDWVASGELASEALASNPFDLVILDLGLPDKDGFDVLHDLRDENFELPVLILTAREATKNKIEGFSLGADDYLTKPFDMEELMARCRALIRRSHGRSKTILRHQGLELNLDQQSLTYKGEPVKLQQLAFRLLTILMERKGRVISKSDLMELLYGWDENAESNVLEVYVSQIRRKTYPSLIRTIRGIGYIIDEPETKPVS
ncbi:MAG: response regulator transcription factor [Cohaesibacter sp.]|jgi:DNA-binding response OmpR family regulator|nr:response regulator transcription factor [Cohaesibacter sp.]